MPALSHARAAARIRDRDYASGEPATLRATRLWQPSASQVTTRAASPRLSVLGDYCLFSFEFERTITYMVLLFYATFL